MQQGEYIIISKAQNGHLVSVNDDEIEDADRAVHVFNKTDELLNHVGELLTAEETDQ